MGATGLLRTETFPGGFRRVWRQGAARLGAGRTRSFLAGLVAGGGAVAANAAQAIGSLTELAALWELGWLGPPRASPRLVQAEIRMHLRTLSGVRRSPPDWLDARPGEVVLLRGRAHPYPPRPAASPAFGPSGLLILPEPGGDPLWSWTNAGTMVPIEPHPLDPSDEALEITPVEVARDFLLEAAADSAGQPPQQLLVRVEGGYLVGARALAPGADVRVLGYFDRLVDVGGEATGHREPPSVAVVRSGAVLPLVVLAERRPVSL